MWSTADIHQRAWYGKATMRDKSWQEALERAGYYVTCVGRGETALQRLDLAVIDSSLPDLPSEVLAHRARGRWPQLRLMLLTGTELTSHPRLRQDPQVLLLSKPATAKIIEKYLGQLFQEPAPVWTVQSKPNANSMLRA